METVKASLQLTAGLAAIGWFLFMVIYRLIVSRKRKVGFLSVDMPTCSRRRHPSATSSAVRPGVPEASTREAILRIGYVTSVRQAVA